MAPLIIVQARLGSTRLPRKVMRPIKGRPMLAYLLDRLPDENVVVATPDQEIADMALEESGVRSFVWDGPEDDVAGRFAACLAANGNPDTFIRLCGDSPLLDYALVEAAATLHHGIYTIVASPVGCVQVIQRRQWSDWLRDQEHVIDARPTTAVVVGGANRLVVDTEEDFARVERVVGAMARPPWTYSWREICAL